MAAIFSRACPPLLLLLLARAVPAASERVEAVVLLNDDDVHSFRDVSSALESLGLSPPQALLVTSDVHTTGVGLICKGSEAELRVARDTLVEAGLNVTLRTTDQTDVEVRRAAKLATSGTAVARRVHVALREAALSRAGCARWSLAGACMRLPMAMFVDLGCAEACVDNTVKFQQAAHHRPPLRLDITAVQVAGVLGGALGAAEGWLRLLGGGRAVAVGEPLPQATAARVRFFATVRVSSPLTPTCPVGTRSWRAPSRWHFEPAV